MQKSQKRPTRKNRSLLLIVFAAVIVTGVFFWFFNSGFYESRLLENKKESLPQPSEVLPTPTLTASALAIESAVPTATPTPIPGELNLDVPFAVQAPSANWDRTHEEACEEAAILMAIKYFNGEKIDSAADAEAGLQEIIAWENENLGFFESTTVAESVKVIKGLDENLNVEVVDNPTVDQIKQFLADNKLVLVPTAGRLLGNPFYKSPGPLYHMLVIKGYTASQFITNDAGTRRGENYPYKYKTLLDANHDYNGGDVTGGKKLMIIVSK